MKSLETLEQAKKRMIDDMKKYENEITMIKQTRCGWRVYYLNRSKMVYKADKLKELINEDDRFYAI